MDALKRAMNDKTRLIILNTPHNPTGKVFSRQELEEIATVIKQNPKTMAWLPCESIVITSKLNDLAV